MQERFDVLPAAISFLARLRGNLKGHATNIREPEIVQVWRGVTQTKDSSKPIHLTVTRESLLIAFAATIVERNEPLHEMFMVNLKALVTNIYDLPPKLADCLLETIENDVRRRSAHALPKSADEKKAVVIAHVMQGSEAFIRWLDQVRWNESAAQGRSSNNPARFSSHEATFSGNALTPSFILGLHRMLSQLSPSLHATVAANALTLQHAYTARSTTEHQPIDLLAILQAIYTPT